MLHIKDDFGKGPVSQVSSSWFNAVAKFVNNLIGTRGIKVTKESDDMPTVELALKQGGGVGLSGDGEVCVMLHENGGISVDDESAGLKVDVADDGGLELTDDGELQIEPLTASSWVKTDGNGKLTTQAAIDAEDVAYGTSTVDAELDAQSGEIDDHEDRISALENAPPSAPVTSVNNKTGAVVLDAGDVGALSEDDIGETVQEHSAKLDALDAALNADGTMPVGNIYDNGCSSSCVALCTNGAFGHSNSSLNNATAMGGDWPVLQSMSNCFTKVGGTLKVLMSKLAGSALQTYCVATTQSDGSIALNAPGNGLEMGSDAVLKVKAHTGISVSSDGVAVNIGSSVNGFVSATNGTLGVPETQPATVPSGTGFVKAQDGSLVIASPQPATVPTTSGYVKSNGSALSTTTKVPVADVNFGTGVTNITTANIASLAVTTLDGSGSATSAARSDHNHNSSYAPISTVSFPGFGTTATTAAYGNHTHGNITNGGALNVSYVNDSLMAVGTNGAITAASFLSQSAPYVTAENMRRVLACHNLESTGTQTIKGAQVKLSTGSKVVKTDANGMLTTATNDYAELDDTAPKSVGTENSAGTSTKAARVDHTHKLVCATNGGLDNSANGVKITDIHASDPSWSNFVTHQTVDGYNELITFKIPTFNKKGQFTGWSGSTISFKVAAAIPAV